MRLLLQPRVLGTATVAAAASALVCYPRLALWLNQPWPVWYLESMLFLCCIMLWSFVFAWHTPCTGRPVFVFKLEPGLVAAATLAGIGVAAVYHRWLDPSLRPKFPREYPADVRHWLATLLFTAGLGQLFQTFACFDWFIRLVRNRWVAMSLTALFGAAVQAMKIHSLAAPLPPGLIAGLLLLRVAGGFLAVMFYLRGGVLLAWWWAFLIESRQLLDFAGHS